MLGLTVVFQTASSIEASVVQALLDSHGIEAVRTAGPPAALFPFTVNPMGQTKVSVRDDEADEALRIIESHREQVGGQLVPLPQQFAALERRLGYRFRDPGLLEHALTHKSKAHEDPSGGVIDNESLEFLGDAVLGLVVADNLCRTFPKSSEGHKSKIKAMMVSTTALAELAERLELGDHMILGRGEEKTGGRRKQALLADTCEALIAAIYLDGGLDPARQFLLRAIGDLIEQAGQPDYFGRDHKSRLQEAVQSLGRPLPHYRVAGEVGPEHRKMFHVEVLIGGELLAQGVGRTKKDAEQEAAKTALENLAIS
ncbi:MAG TPA: ribonuclease III [Vicinamibacterales bacterium]|nr:ribonuclease III [Vicinamibacterales bacterium]